MKILRCKSTVLKRLRWLSFEAPLPFLTKPATVIDYIVWLQPQLRDKSSDYAQIGLKACCRVHCKQRGCVFELTICHIILSNVCGEACDASRLCFFKKNWIPNDTMKPQGLCSSLIGHANVSCCPWDRLCVSSLFVMMFIHAPLYYLHHLLHPGSGVRME